MFMTVTTNRFLFVLTILLSAVSHLFGPPAARAGDMTCSGLIGGARTVTTIDGNVTVPAGTSCTLSFVNITGNVGVGQNATLVVSAYLEPSEIAGNIEANTCNSVLLQGNVTVGGNLNINACNGAASNGFQGPDVLIQGNFVCQSNTGPCLAWLGTVEMAAIYKLNWHCQLAIRDSETPANFSLIQSALSATPTKRSR
jgi:hypothetical protein